MQPKHLFGERSWNDVRDVVTLRTRRKFRRATQDDIEDAVAWAMVDLVDYWVQLPSSIDPDDPERTFWYACRRGTWMSAQYLTSEWDGRDIPVAALSEETSMAESGGSGIPSSAPSPEDIVVSNHDRKHLQAFMLDQHRRVGDWLEPFLEGRSTREQARVEGVNQSAVARRWQHRMASLIEDARVWGFRTA